MKFQRRRFEAEGGEEVESGFLTPWWFPTHFHAVKFPPFWRRRMSFKFHALATFTFPSSSSNPPSKTLVPPCLPKLYLCNRKNPKRRLFIYKTLEPAKYPRFQIRATANNEGEPGNWTKWLPRGVVAADRILRLISSATSSPISQFVSSPTTFLHSVDPRIKLVIFIFLGIYLI